jgi:very-short-patch-repair endonuclease
MPTRSHGPLARCSGIAARQHGVISSDQALAAGLSRDAIQRLIAAGTWTRVRPSVLQLSGEPETATGSGFNAYPARRFGSGATISHRASAMLRGLDGAGGSPLEFSTTGRRRVSEPGLVIHRQSLAGCDVETYQNLRVTTVARTVVDLASVIGGHALELALESALRGRLVTLDQVRDALERSSPNHRGRAGLRHLLDRHPGRPAESALEVLVWRVLLKGGLPPPVRQYAIRNRGRLLARVDFAYPHAKIAIEADGYRFHSSAPDWKRDRERQNALLRLGWSVYRVTWDDASRRGGRQVVADVSGLLAGAVTQIPR